MLRVLPDRKAIVGPYQFPAGLSTSACNDKMRAAGMGLQWAQQSFRGIARKGSEHWTGQSGRGSGELPLIVIRI